MSETATPQEIIESGGIKVPIDPAVITAGILKALRKGVYENARVKCLAGMVEAGDRIIDVGGGMGFTSALMGMGGRPELIVSIDGHPGVQAYAARLHALNGIQGVIHRNALVVTVKAAEREKFFLSADFWGSSMIPEVRDQTGVAEIPVLSFSELIAEYRPNMLVIDLEVMKEYMRPGAASGPVEAMDLTGIDKVVLHLPIHLGGQRGIKRIFDFFSAQDFYYNIDHSRQAVVLFSRITS